MVTTRPTGRGVSKPVAALAVVMAALIVGAVAWAVIRTTSSSGSTATEAETVVLGDSIAVMSSEELVEATDAQVVAFNGARWADLGPAVGRTLAERQSPPKRVAVLLGTNDVLALSVSTVEVAPVLDPLEDVPCVVVFELPGGSGWTVPTLNERLRDEADGRPNVEVDDEWARLANRNRDEEAASWFEDDGIHPAAEGQERLASAVASGLDRHCGASSG